MLLTVYRMYCEERLVDPLVENHLAQNVYMNAANSPWLRHGGHLCVFDIKLVPVQSLEAP